MKDESERDAALITFLATASGMHFLGLSSVFWGICIGLVAHLLLSKPQPGPTVSNTVSLSQTETK